MPVLISLIASSAGDASRASTIASTLPDLSRMTRPKPAPSSTFTLMNPNVESPLRSMALEASAHRVAGAALLALQCKAELRIGKLGAHDRLDLARLVADYDYDW